MREERIRLGQTFEALIGRRIMQGARQRLHFERIARIRRKIHSRIVTRRVSAREDSVTRSASD